VTRPRTVLSTSLTAGADADPVELIAEAVGAVLAESNTSRDSVALVVLAWANPGEWQGAPRSPMLDGDFASGVVRRVLLSNGLVNAVPLGVSLSEPVERLAIDCAVGLMLAEHLETAVAGSLSVSGHGDATQLVAAASALRLDCGGS
jgi:hypothetical protein